MFECAVPPSIRSPCKPPQSSPRFALIVAVLGSSMAFLDGTVVNVALPVMQRDLDMPLDLVQWIVEAYSLLLSSLVLVGGALGDRLGRKRVFSAGTLLFALSSIGCAAAPGALLLIVARAVQGVGAAMLVPGSLSLISAAYSDPVERGRAIGSWSAFTAITASIGPVSGGFIAAHASWRWLFLINVPIAAAVIALTEFRVSETRDETAVQSVDWPGATLVTIGLGLVVYALVDSNRAGGLSSTRTIASLAIGCATLAAFVAVEARRKGAMVPLSLFGSRTFSGTNLLTLLLYAALGGALFFVPFNLIQVQRYSPTAAGAALLPFVVLISAMSRWAGALSSRVGPRIPLTVGPLLAALGFLLLMHPGIGGSYWSSFFPGVVVLGLGMGVTVAPLTAAVMASVDARHSGVASGINNAVSRAAGLLAIAALGVLLAMRFNRALDERLSALALPEELLRIVDGERPKLAGVDLPSQIDPMLRGLVRRAFDEAYVSGFRAAMLAGALLAMLGAVAALVLVEPRLHTSNKSDMLRTGEPQETSK